jgi:prephenate dehydrogenase
MGKITVAVIGLGRMGASVGLALRRYSQQSGARHTFDVVGFDERPEVVRDAEKIGATTSIARGMYDAVRERDIVVIAQPYAEVRRTYQAIGQDVRSGGVVMDLSPLKLPSLGWARDYLHADAHMVGMTPVINPRAMFDGLDETNQASDNYFDNGTMMLMPAPSCIREAVELASDFATLLGSKPHFMDPAEHDSLFAATSGLPSVLGVVAFYMLSRTPGWEDSRRLTNGDFGRLTHHLFDTHPDDLRDLWLSNQASLLHYTTAMIEALESFRAALAASDRAALEALVVDAARDYSGWVNRRFNNKWDGKEMPSAPSAGQTIMSSMMGGFIASRLSGNHKDRDKD